MVPTRRRLLGAAAAGAASLAGCAALGGDCTHRISLTLTPSTVAGIVERDARAPEEMHPVAARLVRRAHETGAATYRAVTEPPVSTYVYVPLDGTYYGIRMDAVETTTVTGYTFDLSMDSEATPAPDASVASLASLPDHDRRAFLAALGFPHPRKFDDAVSMEGSGTIAFAEPSLVESSHLVPEPAYDYVRFRGRPVRLSKTGTTEATVTTYEVTLDPVADTDAALAAHVRDLHGVVLRSDDLSAEQRDVLEEAVGGQYSECDEFSDALLGLRERLADANYARYDGTWYRVELSKTVA